MKRLSVGCSGCKSQHHNDIAPPNPCVSQVVSSIETDTPDPPTMIFPRSPTLPLRFRNRLVIGRILKAGGPGNRLPAASHMGRNPQNITMPRRRTLYGHADQIFAVVNTNPQELPLASSILVMIEQF